MKIHLIIFFVFLSFCKCFADEMMFLVINSSGGKSKIITADGPQKGGPWGFGGFSTSTTNTIYQMLNQVGESGGIGSVTGIGLMPKSTIVDVVVSNAFTINQTTFVDSTESVIIPNPNSARYAFMFRVRKSGSNSDYDTSTFPTNLQVKVQNMWHRFERGDP